MTKRLISFSADRKTASSSVACVPKLQTANLDCSETRDLGSDVQDVKSTLGGMLCIVGSHLFVPISWMRMKQSHNSASSEIISLDADGLPAVQFWACVLESFIGRTAKGNSLSKDDMTKKDRRDVHTRLIPARTPPHLHTTFNCTLSKMFARFNHKSGGTHKLCRFPSQASLSIPLAQHYQTYLNQASKETLCLLFHTTTAGRKPVPPSYQSFRLCSPSTARSRRRARQEKSTHRRRRPARRATARASTRHPCGPQPNGTGVRLLAP